MNSKYDVDTKFFNDLVDKVELPKFQRKLVWSKNEKKRFIETLQNGYPFGAILIYKYEGQDKISLIDGLQRFTTIIDFQKKPENYLEFEELINGNLYTIFDSNHKNSEKIEAAIKKKMKKAIKEYISCCNAGNYTFDTFEHSLKNNLNEYCDIIDQNSKDLMREKEKIDLHLKNYINIDQLRIPTITFTGSVSELSIVFENLNRGGKKLSKYQVFAAQWSKYSINLSQDKYNKKLLKLNIERYKKLSDVRGIAIEDFNEDSMRDERVINMAEFCYAYGYLILEEMFVFWDSENEDLCNQIGYSTLAIVLNKSNKNIHELIEFHNELNSSELLEKLVEKTLEIYRDINSRFIKPFSVPGTNETKFGVNTVSDFQLLSFFAALWNIRYGCVLSNKNIEGLSKHRKEYREVLDNLLTHYIYDVISSKWAGSGDTKLDTIALVKEKPYNLKINKDKMSQHLFDWHDEQIMKGSNKFESVAIMLYTVHCSFYSDTFDQSKYDCEHVVSKEWLKKASKVNIPGGSLGNLMYLDTVNNRSKKEFSLYDNLKPGQNLDESYFSKQEYPSKDEFDAIKQELTQNSLEYSSMRNTIKNRGTNILNSLVNNLIEYYYVSIPSICMMRATSMI